MSDDRLAQARAEAERRQTAKHWRMWEDEGEHLDHSWSMGFMAGFRDGVKWADDNPQPRTITTSEEIDALPTGSIILSDQGHAWQKCPKRERMSEAGWACAGPIYPGIYNDPDSQRGAIFYRGPATVLYQPEVRDE